MTPITSATNTLPINTSAIATAEKLHLKQEDIYYTPKNKNEDLSDWFIRCLMHLGITQAFGLPGAAIEPLYNALGRAKRLMSPGPSVITVKHEAAIAFAAEGYYKVTGKMALCCATAGPGATNLITGLASAKLEKTPMLVITGQTKIKDFSRGAFQDSSKTGLSTVALLDEVCCYSAMVTHPDQLIHKLYTALSIALGSSPGPVHLSIPLDIFRTSLSELHTSFPSPQALLRSLPRAHQSVDLQTLNEIIEIIEDDINNVSLIIGPGCGYTSETLMTLAQKHGWQVMATPSAKGLIDHDHPCFQGIIGFGGHAHAYNRLVETKGPILLLGTPFDEASTGGWDTQQLPFDRVIQVDTNPKNIYTFLPVKIRCLCDIQELCHHLQTRFGEVKDTLNKDTHALNEQSNDRSKNDPSKDTHALKRPVYVSDRHWEIISKSPEMEKCMKPQEFIWRLNQLAGPTTPLCADSSGPFMWSIHLWQSRPCTRGATPNNFHLAMTLATMGWSLGASIGVAQGLLELDDYSPCLCITGDGSYLMSSQEIATAAQLGLNIAFIVLNNSSYGIVEHCQRLVGAEPIAYELPEVNYAQLASAFKVPGFRIQNQASLAIAWQTFMQTPGPALFDVLIDPHELPPLGHRLESLGFAGKNEIKL